MVYYVDPSVGGGLTYCFTDVGVGVMVTPITKETPAPIFFEAWFFSSPVGSLCHTHGVVRRLSSVVCRLCPP